MSKEIQLISRLFTSLAKGEGATLSHRPRLSDIFVRVNPQTGELTLYDAEDESLGSVTLFSWISSEASTTLSTDILEPVREAIAQLESKGLWEEECFVRPFSIVLVNDNFETLEELLYLDDENVLLTSPLLSDLDDELNTFIQEILQDSK